jgi:glutamate dehydrogenase/leucine dehydrogenase
MVSIPARVDTGEYRCFAGYRLQHFSVLGPA